MSLAFFLIIDKGPAFAVSVIWKDMSGTVCPGNTTKDCQESYFVIERKAPGGAFIDVGHSAPDAEQWTDSQVTPGTTYVWRIKAVNDSGSSLYSNEVSFLVPAVVLGIPRLTCSSVPIPPSSSGLVLALGFNATSGTVAMDTSGQNNHGTLSGPTWTTQGKYGGALTFDGVNSTVTVPDASSLDLTSAVTLEAWVFPTVEGTDWRTVILKEQAGGLVYSLYANTNAQRPRAATLIGTTKRYLSGRAALPLNTWSHLAVSYDGSQYRLYLNGIRVANSAVMGPLVPSTGVLRIGGNNVWGEYFQGRIDEVKIYSRALTAAEILTDMNTP